VTASDDSPALKRTLGPLALAGLGVGYVISGEYFGWNLGLPYAGTYGMLAATLVVTVLYAAFVLAYAELACAIPRAGGAFVYATRAFGPAVGGLAGYAQWIEFAFAPPAIAMAIGAYVVQRIPGADPRLVAALAYLVFTGLNGVGVKQAALFEVFVTVLAVVELLVFAAIALPSFDSAAFVRDPLPHGAIGAFQGLPFAIWFYLGIEGVANAAEEARDPSRDVPRGFLSAIALLVVLALLVFVASIGVAGWHAVVYPPGGHEPSDAPLPLALARIVGADSPLYSMLLGIGLLGLIASFHGILLAAGRATFELGRSGFAPRRLGVVHAASGTPRAALVANMLVGLVAIATGKTAEIITLACFGALVLYVLAMASWFRLRSLEPDLERPFRTPFGSAAPFIALVLSILCLGSMAVSSPLIAAVFAVLLLALDGLARMARGRAPAST